MNKGINLAWQAKKASLMGTQMTILSDAKIDAIHLPSGETVVPPYRDNNADNETVNSEEAQNHIGQTGTIVHISFQYRHVRMDNAAIVVLVVTEDRYKK